MDDAPIDHMRESQLELSQVPTPNPIGDADSLESILDAWNEDPSSQVPEFYCRRMLEGLSHLFDAIIASSPMGGSGTDLGDHRTRTSTMLVEIRDLLDQLWLADWPTITIPIERDLRAVLEHLREIEREKGTLKTAAST